MKFEQLPNEILIECLKYLNALDLFYSFDQLNYHFSTLIRNISLHLNLHHINKSLFNQFCQNILLNPQIKSQIISLELSNKNTYGQLNVFLSFFTFKEFHQLRSLTLIDLDCNNVEQIKIILLLLSDFFNTYFNDMMIQTCEILSKLFPSKIQMTSMSNLNFNSLDVQKTMQVTSLRIHDCVLDDLYQLFQCLSMLKYLYIERFEETLLINDESDIINVYAIYLKQLIMNSCYANFKIFKLLLKQTPYLKILTITVEYKLDIIGAERWEHLITSSLHHLDIFNFKFVVWINNNFDDIFNKFQQFQTDFWYKKHRWYTNYEFSSITAIIYTIPYVWNIYMLKLMLKKSDILLMKNRKIFDNVTDLDLFLEVIDDQCEYYFQNVKSLTLLKERNTYEEFFDCNPQLKNEKERLESLKNIVNLSNLKHLDIKCICNIISSTLLLEILKQAPHLLSLVINKPTLISFLTNTQLCQYLNKMIKILDIIDYYGDKFIKSDELNKLCKIFINVEELQCYINETDVFLFILNHLPKLKNIQVKNFPVYVSPRNIYARLKMTASKLNIN